MPGAETVSAAVKVSGVFQVPSRSSPEPSQLATEVSSHTKAISSVHEPSGSPNLATIETKPSSLSPFALRTTLNEIPDEGSSLVSSSGS